MISHFLFLDRYFLAHQARQQQATRDAEFLIGLNQAVDLLKKHSTLRHPACCLV
jgi:hypothetical protein